jgi:hypothetical protein
MIWIAGAKVSWRATDNEPDVGSPALLDEFVESYVCWREESAATRSAYETYAGEENGGNRALAFAAYQAALDREERAARVYQDCAERVAGTR